MNNTVTIGLSEIIGVLIGARMDIFESSVRKIHLADGTPLWEKEPPAREMESKTNGCVVCVVFCLRPFTPSTLNDLYSQFFINVKNKKVYIKFRYRLGSY